MKGERKKITRATVISIITAAVFVLAAVALIITNIFIPVKYLACYVLAGSDAIDGSADVTFVDVGYGTSIIVRFPDGRVMLIDGGDGSYTNRCEIIKQLNAMDIDNIDWLVCTSVNAEHCGGLAEVIKYKSAGTIYYPYCKNVYITDEYHAFYNAAVSCGADMIYSEYGVGASGDNYFFSFLSPSSRTNPLGEYEQLNSYASTDTISAASAVLWVECCGTSFLFCSDATEDVMTKICENYLMFTAAGDSYAPQDSYSVRLEKLNVAEAANHGGCASAVFYDYVKPDCTIISVGENTSGSPALDAMTTICNSGDAYTTQDCGNIKINVFSDSYEIIKEKQ